MIPASELTAMRAVASSALDMTCTIQRNSGTGSDAYGFQAQSWANHATGVACSLNKPSAALMAQYASKIGELQTWLVSLPYGTSIQVNPPDRIVVSGQTLEVQADVSLSSYSTLVQVLASEVR